MSEIKEKPQYEPPRIILLNELSSGRGVAYCRSGSSNLEVCEVGAAVGEV
jgi:hypothetical protein